MCGIAGWVGFDRDLTVETTTIDAMTETLAYRGPDACGTWVCREAAVGHRRLAVIDLDGGVQPMSVDTEAGKVIMVYSGETYNYLELRDELRRRGHSFRTESDTEVVLRGYLEWGEALAEKLNGMYAFAIWDSRHAKLVLIRDRLGVKPLYYYRTADGLLFGSEPKAILANPLAKRVVGLDGLREVFSFVRSPGAAVWEGMSQVEPGTVVTLDRTGLRTHVYWKLETREHVDDELTTVRHVRELLDDIVRRQMVADVPLCVLLSGGLDSSALTALATRRPAEPNRVLRTCSVDYVGQRENFKANELRGAHDTPYVHEVVRRVKSQHSEIVLDTAGLADPEVRRAVLAAQDIPVGLGDIDASLYLLFKSVREQSTVALSGEAADELFGGYRWFHQPEVQRADTFPWIAGLSRNVPHNEPAGLLDPDLLGKLDRDSHLQDGYRAAVSTVDRLPGADEHEHRMRVISHLHLTRLVRMLLDRKDRFSMAVGLEVRVPFCDHRLVEYVYNAPWSLKAFDGREKSLLRGAVRDVLPRSVLDRAKSPYPSSQDPAYAVALRDQAKRLLADDDPVFAMLNRAWLEDAVRDGAAVIGPSTRHGLERVLNLSTWLDLYRPEIRTS
ncbi:asparagine synthase (glutamine-hydrolyzing) [Amycolatopsis sp. cg5]|uniref:asparagine synthase (glutamine-hydrolyzing) n=1 Tax=Amycolatopsis sp. cg5 TaxID=3238802 RepID=UPI003525B9B3